MYHMFVGTFEACLFSDITLSIQPETHTPEMTSWFPIAFPIKMPIDLRQGDQLECIVSRCRNDQRVWYEWTARSPTALPQVHNSTGSVYTLNL